MPCAQPRATKDIDIFIKADAENARAAYAALAAFGAPLQNIRAEDLAEPNNFFRFGREPRAIDILPSIDGIEFDIAWRHCVEGVIDPPSGLKAAYFISAADLVTSKIAAGRIQDLADVEALRKTREIRAPEAQS